MNYLIMFCYCLRRVQQLVQCCGHRTPSVRLKSVIELCRVISSLHSDAVADVGQLLDVAGAMFIDDDRKVRCEARKLLRMVISRCKCVTSDVLPFFPLMMSRLCCAMTHVHEDIR